MSDCSNIEIREALPELLHGRLDAAQAAKVRAHIASCAECASELELLERVQRIYSVAPAVNTAAIVRALPRPRTRRTFSLGVLRAAAAIVVLLAGALVIRAAMSGSENGKGSQVVVTQDTPAVKLQRDTQGVPIAREPRVLAMSLSELDDLDADEMESLMRALERIDAAPVAEPDTLMGSVSGVGT
jgi:anti-sigma factor RsiW